MSREEPPRTSETELALQTIAEALRSRAAGQVARTGWSRLASLLRSNWVLVLAGVSVVLALLGWVIYGVSPLHNVAELAERQAQRKLDHQLVSRHLALGNAFLGVGQLEAAKAEFTQALELDARNAEAQLGLLKTAVFEPIVAGDYDPEVVERRLTAILAERPGDPHALAVLGDVYSIIDPDSAMAYYRLAVRADERTALAFFGMAVLYDTDKSFSTLRGAADSALRLYERAAKLSPWNQTYLNNLAYQYYLRGDYRRAEM